MQLETILEKVDTLLPPQPTVQFRLVKESAGLFDSKVGGTPYFPRGMEYPRGRKGKFAGEPLVLLAQLNFSQLPHIPDFPETGMLQFYIAADDLYGMSDDFGSGMAMQENFRVIYHEEIITDEAQLLSADEIPHYSGEGYLPFKDEFRLEALAPDVMRADVYDFRFSEAFVDSWNALCEDEIEELWDAVDDDEYDSIAERNEREDAFIGGYPVFTQDDPRCSEEIADCDTVLFELDSVSLPEGGYAVLWGDAGTGTFLIPREALRRRDFSRVLYNYDCC